jgi:hypothetical protein
LEIIQGTEFRRRFRAYADMDKTTAIDFTDYSIELTCRARQWNQSPIIVTATTGNGRIVNGALSGYFDVVIGASVTSGLEDGDYYYWLVLYPTGFQDMSALWLQGPLKVLPGVV